MTTTLRTFTTANPTASKDVVVEGNAWRADCYKAQSFQLFELPNPGVEGCIILYRAKLRSEELVGRAYLEMWCRLPNGGEFFSKGINQAITGSNDWVASEIPFILQQGEKPDLIRLNLAVENATWLWKKTDAGTLWVKDVELARAPLR
jgi:hypothetical protein